MHGVYLYMYFNVIFFVIEEGMWWLETGNYKINQQDWWNQQDSCSHLAKLINPNAMQPDGFINPSVSLKQSASDPVSVSCLQLSPSPESVMCLQL